MFGQQANGSGASPNGQRQESGRLWPKTWKHEKNLQVTIGLGDFDVAGKGSETHFSQDWLRQPTTHVATPCPRSRSLEVFSF